jgi:hypothetical protein
VLSCVFHVKCPVYMLLLLVSLQVPTGTLVDGCAFSDMGVFVKQAGAVYMALSANSTIRRNIAYNLPRAAVNYNDGAFGGHLLSRNLFFNAVSLATCSLFVLCNECSFATYGRVVTESVL